MNTWGTEPQAGDAWSGAPAPSYAGASSFRDEAATDFDANFGGDFQAADGFQDTRYPKRESANAAENGAEDKCFGCGEVGHRRAECPNPQEMTCRYCKKPGHMVKDCPDKPPMFCDNCGEEGHMRKNCDHARKINRDNIASVDPDAAWAKIKQAVSERDIDDAKEGVQEYVKALDGKVTYRELQEAFIAADIGLWFIAVERPLLTIFTNMDLQGNMGKKYTVSFRLSEKPDRPREAEGWPKDRDEILSRLDDAGDVADKGLPLCHRCRELGHTSKFCTIEAVERTDAPKISCYNCGADGHRVRDCPEPIVDKFACKNCGQSGHKAADCEEPPNPANVECRKCNEMGHFAKDCPQGGGSRACRNCGQEGHMARECDQPRNMDNVICRNCEKPGHFSKECPEPKDWSKVQCSNCQEYGHTKVRCKQPLADDDHSGYTDGGFENSGDFGNTGNSYGDGGASEQVAVDSGGW